MALKIAECGGSYGPLSKSPECWAARAEVEGQANARLIAAAPDMLTALKRAAPWLGKLIADGGHMHSVAPNDAIGTLERVEAAIAKATGGTDR